MIKDEGAFSSMHSFLVYLQMAPMEQQPVVATLLLQLDLLVCPINSYTTIITRNKINLIWHKPRNASIVSS